MTTATPLPPPPVEQPAQPSRPPLQRSAADRMLGGVCGGLAEYSRIDPLLWRVGAIGLTLVGPGLFLYLLLWVLMDPAPGVPDADRNFLDRWAAQLHDRLRGPRSTRTV